MPIYETEIIWAEHGNYIIRDVHTKWHNRIVRYMLEHHFHHYHIYKKLEIDLEEENYIKYLKHILRAEMSIVVMDRDEMYIYGVALLKIMTQEWRSWAALTMVAEDGVFGLLTELRRKMMLSYKANNPKLEFDSLHLFEYTVCNELKQDELFMQKFFDAICDVSRHMYQPRLTFLAWSMHEQQLAKAAGWNELLVWIYSLYLKDGKRPFDKLRIIEEMHAILYEYKNKPITPYYEMNVHQVDI